MDIFLSILLNSIIPIYILIALGWILDKAFKMDMNTLIKINFYLFIPAFLFVNLLTTDITANLVGVLALTVLLVAVGYAMGAGVAKLLKMPKKTARVFENTLMFNNSGTVGVSLIALVYSGRPFVSGGDTQLLEAALSVQIIVMMAQNLCQNTIGVLNSGGDDATIREGLKRVVRLPVLYTIAAALLFKLLPLDLTVSPIWPALTHLRNGLISVVLITLGAQLSKTRFDFKAKTPYFTSLLKLIVCPMAAYVLIKLFGFTGVTAQASFILASTPVAVNTALLAQECKGDVEFAAQSVFISTLMSAVTMTIAVYLAYILF